MTIPQHGPKSRPPGPSGPDQEIRPKIWVEGRQQPKFNLGAWARVSLTITRRNLGPLMDAGAARTHRFGQSVLQGERRPDLAWLGRAAKAVPSHQSVGALVTGAAQLLADGREIVLPAPVPEDPIAYPHLIRPDFAQHSDAPARVPRPRLADVPPRQPAAAPGDEPTLGRIRALITETGGSTVRSGRRATDAALPELQPQQPAPPGPLQRLHHATAALIWRGAAAALAWGLTVLCLPYGGVKAALFHFDGGDLRDFT